jgi:hypothetical protein
MLIFDFTIPDRSYFFDVVLRMFNLASEFNGPLKNYIDSSR